ncbi:TfuA-like protein, partial [Facilibium subflavum]|uniref:TfuA-like protein n=1 Tax=Facilibium subflavum TaxID=2219058 RepID=UPI001AAD68B1
MTRQNKIVVFSEITLSKEAVKQYLPETVIKPSIKTGDLIQACKEGFEVAVIIDGVFDFISSVWHKEILWVMAQGMDVIGCASMGALRAAELYTYGMKGSGYVFEAYKSGLTDDDSEVAVNFYQLDKELMTSIALINIRYTLDILKQEGCDQVILDTTWQKTSAVFYKKRTWPYLQDQLTPEAFNLLKTHYVDIKALDARQCLQSLPSLINIQQKIVTVPQTLFLNKLIRDIYYQDDIQAIADILQKHYIQAPQY